MANHGLLLLLQTICLYLVKTIFLLLPTIQAIPPPPPVQCTAATGCHLYNSYGVWGDRKDCLVPSITYPTTQQQLLSIVANATKNNLKLKLVSKFSHTIPKLACPATTANSILISTENYNSLIEVDATNLRVTADAGAGLRAVIDKVELAGLSLVAAPYWEGVSMGGLISTGAHGSSWWGNGGAVHDHVVGITMVVAATESEGYAKIVELDESNPLLDAAKVSLGILGVISKVTLRLEKGFKRSITYKFTKDERLEDEFMVHGKRHEFGDITWYPSKHVAVYRNDDRVALETAGDGVNDFLGFQSNLMAISQATRATGMAYRLSCNWPPR